MACAPSEDSDQSGHPPSLIRVFAVRMKKAWVLYTDWAHSEDSDQTGRMPRLIWFFAGRKVTLLVLSCRGSIFCSGRCHLQACISKARCIFADKGPMAWVSWLHNDLCHFAILNVLPLHFSEGFKLSNLKHFSYAVIDQIQNLICSLLHLLSEKKRRLRNLLWSYFRH